MASHIKHKIIIKDLTIPVHLGMTIEEQKHLQEVRWTIQFTAVIGEDRKPLVCYKEVSDRIKSYSQSDKFSSMEELVLFCYDKIKKDFPKIKSLSLNLHKVSPPLKDLSGGVFFEYGDC
ncbi:MAG: dihydroneopterin aldolase [Bdellovibrionales bacterium]|nr:dihydroneopterin aldolase [Bdellovibrionales bacterium]